MMKHEVDESLVEEIAHELSRLRRRPLNEWDRPDDPVGVPEIERLARAYAAATGPKARRRDAQIRILLDHGLAAYAHQGVEQEAESRFIRSLFFDTSGSAPAMRPRDLLGAAKKAAEVSLGDGYNDERFNNYRRTATEHFSDYLITFVAESPLADAAPVATDQPEPTVAQNAPVGANAAAEPAASTIEPVGTAPNAPVTEALGVASMAATAVPETAPDTPVGAETVAASTDVAAMDSVGAAPAATAIETLGAEPETMAPEPAAAQPTTTAVGETTRPGITWPQSSLLKIGAVVTGLLIICGLLMTLIAAATHTFDTLAVQQGPTPPGIATFSVGPAVVGHTIPELVGQFGAPTFTDPHTLGVGGHRIPPYTVVQVSCRVFAPTIPSASPDGFWYRIASLPWANNYYAVANTFQNGDPIGEDQHATDFAVPVCPTS